MLIHPKYIKPTESRATLVVAFILFGLMPLVMVPIGIRGRDSLTETSRGTYFDPTTKLFREIDTANELPPQSVQIYKIYEKRHESTYWKAVLGLVVGICNMTVIGMAFRRRQRPNA